MEHMIPAWMLIPFIAQLLCIAILPLTRLNEWWESNLNKLFISLVLGLPVGVWLFLNGMFSDLEHQMIYDYVPFILLLMALFTVTGGICIKGDLKPTPITNTIIIAIGWLLASFVGTTGAAMLLIRLLLQTVGRRKYKVHTVMFFIAIAANCGGLLTPLGDPPLFLLFQKGAPFEWFMSLLPEWGITGGLLLGIYFIMDTYYYSKEKQDSPLYTPSQTKITVTGLINIVWLAGIILSTMFVNSKYIPRIGEPDAPFYLKLLREWIFVLIIALSMLTTKRTVRQDNKFSWKPILEVTCVFLGIFATMTPALMFLKQHPLPIHEPWQFVYTTGALSAFLDNAPTAMVFHTTAGTLDVSLAALEKGYAIAGISEQILKAICMGAVFFGSLTYIGNGPNFMVKSIAEESGVRMPSFFGYMFRFSLIILLPVYILVQVICI